MTEKSWLLRSLFLTSFINKTKFWQKSQRSPSTDLFSQSLLLARAAHRQQLFAKDIELKPDTFDQPNDEDESSSDTTSTPGAKILFGSGKKVF
jgi:hypothetical protein